MSNTNCHWLPEMILHNENESVDDYLNKIYPIFEHDFKYTHPLFKGLKVAYRKWPTVNNREDAFYHLTSRDYEKTGYENRQFDEERTKRFPWIRPTIENYGCLQDCCKQRVMTWEKKNRYTLLFPEERYIIILDNKKTYYTIVTAYYIDDKHQHELNRYIHQHSK